MIHPRWRLVTAVIVIASMSVACTRAVLIPTPDAADPQYRQPGSYRIRLTSREDYLVRRFSMTDSTVVVEEMLSGDERYRTRRTDLPIAIPLSEVESISRTSTNWWVMGPVLVAGGVALGYFLVLLFTWDSDNS